MATKNKADQRLLPSRRVKRRQDFLRIQSEGKKLRAKHFLVILSPRQTSTAIELDSRIGVTVTRKIDKRAVYRNRLKRYIREIFRAQRERLTSALDIVVICLAGSVELTYSEVEQELLRALTRGGYLRKPRA